jgi:hypothetical protein
MKVLFCCFIILLSFTFVNSLSNCGEEYIPCTTVCSSKICLCCNKVTLPLSDVEVYTKLQLSIINGISSCNTACSNLD